MLHKSLARLLFRPLDTGLFGPFGACASSSRRVKVTHTPDRRHSRCRPHREGLCIRSPNRWRGMHGLCKLRRDVMQLAGYDRRPRIWLRKVQPCSCGGFRLLVGLFATTSPVLLGPLNGLPRYRPSSAFPDAGEGKPALSEEPGRQQRMQLLAGADHARGGKLPTRLRPGSSSGGSWFPSWTGSIFTSATQRASANPSSSSVHVPVSKGMLKFNGNSKGTAEANVRQAGKVLLQAEHDRVGARCPRMMLRSNWCHPVIMCRVAPAVTFSPFFGERHE